MQFLKIAMIDFYQFGSVWLCWSGGCGFMSGILERPWIRRLPVLPDGVHRCLHLLTICITMCMQHMLTNVWDFFIFNLLNIVFSFTLALTENLTVKSYQVITGENQGLSLVTWWERTYISKVIRSNPLILTAVPNSSMLSSWFLLIDKPTLVKEITFDTHAFMLLWAFNQS